jgi:alpha-galactosidase
MGKTRQRSHPERPQDPAAQAGLPGEFPRPIRLTVLGAGGGFTLQLLNDVLRAPGSQGGEIALVDTDAERLKTMQLLIERLAAMLKRSDWTIAASTDRREVLRGTHYLVNCIEVSGLACVRHDNDIPLKYGVDQCIGDTIGPGGIFKALRTIPVWLEILRDAEELCPEALILNYTNPMSMVCLAAGRATKLPIVGLCHSVQITSRLLAHRAEVPYEEMVWECGGINHLAWFTKLEHRGRDLYPLLKEKARRDLAGKPPDPKDGGDLVRKDMMLQFGAFVAGSSGHLSEYLPYYRKRKDLLKTYCRPGYDGESRFYADNWPAWRKTADAERARLLSGEAPMSWPRSQEYAAWIIEAREKDRPYQVPGNVMNSAGDAGPLIPNLPHDGCVEVAVKVDRRGFRPVVHGKLPPQMAAICASNMAVVELGATAALTRSKEAAIQAMLLDPLTAAVCSPAEIRQMTLELFEAEKESLPGYA